MTSAQTKQLGLTILHHLRQRGTTSSIATLKTSSAIKKLTKSKHISSRERRRELMPFLFSREMQSRGGKTRSIRMEANSDLTSIQISTKFNKSGKCWYSRLSQANLRNSINYVEFVCQTKASKESQVNSELRCGLSRIMSIHPRGRILKRT